MKHGDVNICIPGFIIALPGLSLSEKIALAHIHQWPGTSNARLASLLGISVRGVEQMLRRFRERELIQQTGNGHARVLRLIHHVEHHTECEEDNVTQLHTNSGEHGPSQRHYSCGPSLSRTGQPAPPPPESPQPLTTCVPPEQHVWAEVKFARESFGRGDIEGSLRRYQRLKRYIAEHPNMSQERKAAGVEAITAEETRVLLCKLVLEQAKAKNMPREELSQLIRAVCATSEDRLVELRPTIDDCRQARTPIDFATLLSGEQTASRKPKPLAGPNLPAPTANL